LGLPKPKPAPHNLRMADQTTTKPMGLIRNLKIYVHDKLFELELVIVTNIKNPASVRIAA